ncbi:MAG: HEAT repeat domain-containing protein [Acidobacteriota bacterium]
MDKNEFTDNVLLSLYGELDEEQEKELTRLLRENREYVDEYRDLVRIHSLAGQALMEVSEDMTAQARNNLGRALLAESEPRPLKSDEEGFSLPGISRRVIAWLEPASFSTWAKCTAGLAAGLVMGLFFFNNNGMPAFESVPDLAALDERTSISDVRFVPIEGNGKTVELSFSATRHYSLTDSIENPEVQRLLAYSLVRESNPGVRIQTVGLLKDNAGMSRQEIKNALLTAVVTDENPVVRGQALSALKKYPEDKQVQSTLINVVRFDKNSKMRMEAINMLSESVTRGNPVSLENIDALEKQEKVEGNLYMKNRLNNILEKVSLEKL